MAPMSQPEQTPGIICAALVEQYTGKATSPDMLVPVAAGASGRSIMRAHGVLAIHWTSARADNNSFLPAAKGLAAGGVRVPQILAELALGNGCGACLVEDLGTEDLLGLRDAPPQRRMEAYRQALDTLRTLSILTPDWELQPAFDAAMYRWEQEYFAEHLLGRHLGRVPADFLSRPALREMAEWLAALPRVPVHRDCQSQNIMLRDGKAWFIDFQGMRYGRSEYDLASLLCDPYMELTPEERASLINYWEQITGAPLDASIYSACAMQRLMQALGAFANIGYNMNKSWYLQQIPAGISILRTIAAATPAHSPAYPVAQCLLSSVK